MKLIATFDKLLNRNDLFYTFHLLKKNGNFGIVFAFISEFEIIILIFWCTRRKQYNHC